ncbi:MAG TPA: tRNA lysidine(34) synthetase TilS [Dehalococcoidia bacterium]|nr:tRNA lysidine(34) synthetase TilS [Dehalococcoidia bacterium]
MLRKRLPKSSRTSRAFERLIQSQLSILLEDLGLSNLEKVVIACSGGGDSTALLIAVRQQFPELQITAAYFDHAIRDEKSTKTEEKFVAEIAADLGVYFVTARSTEDLNSEEKARTARYQWLAEVCDNVGAEICMTGHQANDQAETVLLNILRGTGSTGMSGMLASALWPVKNLASTPHPTLIRPLLKLWRDDIDAYLCDLAIEPQVDHSNQDAKYLRNKLRITSVPHLRTINPKVENHLVALAEDTRLDDEFLMNAAQMWLDEKINYGQLSNDTRQNEIKIPRTNRSGLSIVPKPIFSRILKIVTGDLGLTVSRSQIEAAHSICGRANAGVSIIGGEIRTERSWFVVSKTDVR